MTAKARRRPAPGPHDFGPWHEGVCRTCRREAFVVGVPDDVRCVKCWNIGAPLPPATDTSAKNQVALFEVGQLHVPDAPAAAARRRREECEALGGDITWKAPTRR